MTEEEKYSILNDLSIQKTILENTFAQENLDEYDEELLEQYQEELDIYKRTIDYINKQADEIEKLKKENEELKNTNSSTDSSAEILGEVLRKISSKLITMKFELDKQNDKIFSIYHEQINKREWWKDEKFLKELLEEN